MSAALALVPILRILSTHEALGACDTDAASQGHR
jgi:hypothetical protein